MENKTLYRWTEDGGKGDSIKAELISTGWVKISQRFDGKDKEMLIDNIDWAKIVTAWTKEQKRLLSFEI